MAYSAILIPHLEDQDAELHATQEQTSWIGKQLLTNRIIRLARYVKIYKVMESCEGKIYNAKIIDFQLAWW